jgi:hypothetical protein
MPALALPRPDDLHAAPERAALALLDAALAVARAALIAQNPDIALLGDPRYGRDPPPTTVIAALLVARSDALHDMLAGYLIALEHIGHEDEDLPF